MGHPGTLDGTRLGGPLASSGILVEFPVHWRVWRIYFGDHVSMYAQPRGAIYVSYHDVLNIVRRRGVFMAAQDGAGSVP